MTAQIRYDRSDLPELPSFRDELGRFTAAGYQEQLARNIRMSETLRADVGRRMRNHIAFGGRAGVSTGRLLKVTVDPANSLVDRWSVGVGRPGYLNRSVAKYWRTFEEGSAATWTKRSFVGMQLRGRFGGTIIGYAPTRTPGPQPQPLAGGPWNARGGKLRWYWNMPLNPNFVVKREIQPANIYVAVAREHRLDEYGMQAAIRFFDGVFRRGLTPPAPMGGFYSPRS